MNWRGESGEAQLSWKTGAKIVELNKGQVVLILKMESKQFSTGLRAVGQGKDSIGIRIAGSSTDCVILGNHLNLLMFQFLY